MFKKDSGFWKDDFDSMALKTVTKLNLSKNSPLSIDMQKGIIADQSVVKNVNEDDTIEVDYIDNGKQEINPEDKLAQLQGLFEEKQLLLSDEDRLFIQNVIDTKDEVNYDKVLFNLKNLK